MNVCVCEKINCFKRKRANMCDGAISATLLKNYSSAFTPFLCFSSHPFRLPWSNTRLDQLVSASHNAKCVEYSSIRCGPKCKCKGKYTAQNQSRQRDNGKNISKQPLESSVLHIFFHSQRRGMCFANLTCTSHVRIHTYIHKHMLERASNKNKDICRATQIPRTLWIFVYSEAFM